MVQVVFLNSLYMFQQQVPQERRRQNDKRRRSFSAYLSHLSVHSAALHAFHADAHTCLLDLALLLLLAVLEVTAMTELHEVAGLVDLALEPAEGLLNGLALTDLNLDGDGKGGGGGSSGGCIIGKEKVERDKYVRYCLMRVYDIKNGQWETAGI